jgi:flagellar biosynthesis/type III secretory pathway chaperone
MTSLKGSSLDRLIDLLGMECAVARELLPVLREKQRALVENRQSALADLSAQELALAGRMTRAEGDRIEATAAVAHKLGLGVENLTLGGLLAALTQDETRTALTGKAEELERTLAEAAFLNDDNRHLTQNLLDYTAFALRLFTQGEGPGAYGRDGRLTNGQTKRAILDDRV